MKECRAPIRPFHIKPGIIMAQMEKQFQEEETKVLCITHRSTFAITILPTLDVKKIQNTHKKNSLSTRAGLFRHLESTIPAVCICWVCRKSGEQKLQYIISCCEGYHRNIHSTAVSAEIEITFLLQLNL